MDTKGTYHSASFYPGLRIKWVLRKQRRGHIFYPCKDTKEQWLKQKAKEVKLVGMIGGRTVWGQTPD